LIHKNIWRRVTSTRRKDNYACKFFGINKEVYPFQLFWTAVIGTLVLGGERINKSIDGWIEIGKKLQKLFMKILPSRIDENAALLLSLNDLLAPQHNVKGYKITNISIQVNEFTPVAWGKGVIDKRPDALYIITIVLTDRIFVYGIKSTSKIDFKKEYKTSWTEMQ
jgi:hypothetical protein